MKKKMNIPKWGYALIVLCGPAFGFGLFLLICNILGALFDLFAKFPYWWAVAVVIGYLFVGAVLAGMVASIGADDNE